MTPPSRSAYPFLRDATVRNEAGGDELPEGSRRSLAARGAHEAPACTSGDTYRRANASGHDLGRRDSHPWVSRRLHRLPLYDSDMVPEEALEPTPAGLVPASDGWFVLNAREARWIERPGRGMHLPFTGWTEAEVESYFPQLGIALVVIGPGEPIGMYHWEADQEDFLVLSGEALLIVEGEERPLRQWDFVHCPPHTEHMIIGAGNGPCVVLAVGAREHQTGEWGAYTVNEVALAHGVGVDAETSDANVAYARFPKPEPTPYRGGSLPSD
jgi:uncharacterized cupin superfamily protein